MNAGARRKRLLEDRCTKQRMCRYVQVLLIKLSAEPLGIMSVTAEGGTERTLAPQFRGGGQHPT